MERTGLRRAQQDRLPLYERTRSFRAYSSWLIPGMIQTPTYTEVALRALQQRRASLTTLRMPWPRACNASACYMKAITVSRS